MYFAIKDLDPGFFYPKYPVSGSDEGSLGGNVGRTKSKGPP